MPTIKEIENILQLEHTAAGKSGTPFVERDANGNVTKPGLQISQGTNQSVEVADIGKTGDPSRFPKDLLPILDKALTPLVPGGVTPLYGKSSETLRRAQTMRSVLETWLTDHKERIKNLKIPLTEGDPETLRNTFLKHAPEYDHIECFGGDFPQKPSKADLALLTADKPGNIPLMITAVKKEIPHPTEKEKSGKPVIIPATRTVIISEYDVTDKKKQRPDIVSMSYEVSKEELEALKSKRWAEIDPGVRKAKNLRMYVGDINRPLKGSARGTHGAKTFGYGEQIVKSAFNQIKSQIGLHVEGQVTVSLRDVHLNSPLFIVEDESGGRVVRSSPTTKSGQTKPAVIHLELTFDVNSPPDAEITVKLRTNRARTAKRRTESQLAKLLGSEAATTVKQMKEVIRDLRKARHK